MSKLRPVSFKGIRKMFGGRFRAGSWAVAAAAIVIAIAIFLNMIAGSLPSTITEIDMTANAIYALSDQTKRIAASLDKDVTLSIICNTGNEDPTINRLLKRYAALSSHIKVVSVDPTTDPTFLSRYELELTQLYENSVLVTCGAKYRLVGYDEIFVTDYVMDYYSYSYQSTTSFGGENALTNAIHYVSRDDLPKVYMLTGHGEKPLSGSIEAMLAQENVQSAVFTAGERAYTWTPAAEEAEAEAEAQEDPGEALWESLLALEAQSIAEAAEGETLLTVEAVCTDGRTAELAFTEYSAESYAVQVSDRCFLVDAAAVDAIIRSLRAIK